MNAPSHPLSQFVKIPGIATPIPVESISHFEGFGNYSRLFFVGKTRPIVASQTLKLFELQLPGFLRVSKSYLVNPLHITALDRQDGRTLELTLDNQASVLVARRRVEHIRTQLITPGTH
ncbi:LytTR family transcriptional regulator [Spirosoma agri]|uniref:LytTR family transcriptional regulator n=1 Tax=Spirosoma agri TaxID=1987381 RepID=A0A6M0IQE1_9BACT|nr:LytTR family DNA-binding domain-containing protein [Spirosoma agri]NEU70182.1 LytTR family transcriptional regulator [Spirosoma agri]